MTRIEGTQVLLRELDPADTGPLHNVYGDPVVCAGLSFAPKSFQECEDIIVGADLAADAEPRTVYMLAIADRQAGELTGVARLALEQWSAAQFGMALRADMQRQGKGREALRLLFSLAFGELDLHRVWGARSPSNEASRRLMPSAGMTEDGRIRSHVKRHGVWEDSCTASILAEEYRASGPGQASAGNAPY